MFLQAHRSLKTFDQLFIFQPWSSRFVRCISFPWMIVHVLSSLKQSSYRLICLSHQNSVFDLPTSLNQLLCRWHYIIWVGRRTRYFFPRGFIIHLAEWRGGFNQLYLCQLSSTISPPSSNQLFFFKNSSISLRGSIGYIDERSLAWRFTLR
jgi:hypothetical protein